MTREEFISRAVAIHGDQYDYTLVNYRGTRSKVKIFCPKHGGFMMTAARHIAGRGCERCCFERFQRERRLSFWEFVEAVANTHGPYRYDYQLENHINQYSKIKIICPSHGEFLQSVANHMRGHGCPTCSESEGERRVREALMALSIGFLEQHRFANCKSKRALPFDFYVPEHKLAIEFDGQQHYEASNYWGGEAKFEQTKRHDQIKSRFTRENALTLLRIPYWEMDSVEDLVLDALVTTSNHTKKVS
ncbi:PDDEXK family nuclease [Novipirellula artificiosorum]|nr:hypothetical protein [Novipirellula artificiosorum]